MKFVMNLSRPEVLMFPVIRRTEAADISKIIRIEAMNGYSMICFTNGQKFLSSKVLRWFEEQLPSELFVRVHRTHLVNKNFICRYINHGKKIGLSNGESVEVSRRKKREILRLKKAA
jgi:DNA-binding LytR/AlgR family response regulator